MMAKAVYIVSIARTPIGSFGGKLADFTAIQLGSIALKGALDRIPNANTVLDEVLMGNVLSAGLGQAPARQAMLGAGIPNSVDCTTINKVCASGLKAITFAAQSIALGLQDVVAAGGMESMSQVPYYLPKARFGHRYGNGEILDGLVKDGLQDAYNHTAMGISGDKTAEKYGFTRAQQDAYAADSYRKAAAATQKGDFKPEIVPVEIPQKKGSAIQMIEDEEFKNVIFDKIPTLRPAFSKDGTVTAANASTLNDGAAAMILASEAAVKKYGWKPLARIVSYADAACEPLWFTTAPTLAAPKALKRAGLKVSDIDFYEVNEAFSVVPMAFAQIMGISAAQMNIYGGAVSLGHPLGCSGARIAVTLTNILQQKQAKYGMAAICNGGGAATSLIIERL
jgi:acetyl-CoA C-acetyltransferase